MRVNTKWLSYSTVDDCMGERRRNCAAAVSGMRRTSASTASFFIATTTHRGPVALGTPRSPVPRCLGVSSMGHGVEEHVDADRVPVGRKAVEEARVFTLAFPGVGDVGV